MIFLIKLGFTQIIKKYWPYYNIIKIIIKKKKMDLLRIMILIYYYKKMAYLNFILTNYIIMVWILNYYPFILVSI